MGNIRMSMNVETGSISPDDRPQLDLPSSSAVDIQLMKNRLKTATQSAKDRQWEYNHSFPHYLMHIPKTGGYNAYRKISSTLSHSDQYNELSPQDRYRMVNIAEAPITKKSDLPSSYGGTRCNMWMSEFQYYKLPLEMIPKYMYTIIRNPRHHVLSQYFHCTESNDRGARHKRAKRQTPMPELDEWLTEWILALDDPVRRWQNYKFRCYYPIDLQSTYVVDTKDYDADLGSIRHIQQKFTVIGPLDEMDKVLCVILIHYAGFLPDACNCSNGENKHKQRRRLSDHGVIHHGSTYNTTSFQDAMIEKLVAKDQILYDYSLKLFNVQLRLVEEYFNVTICDAIE